MRGLFVLGAGSLLGVQALLLAAQGGSVGKAAMLPLLLALMSVAGAGTPGFTSVGLRRAVVEGTRQNGPLAGAFAVGVLALCVGKDMLWGTNLILYEACMHGRCVGKDMLWGTAVGVALAQAAAWWQRRAKKAAPGS